MKVNKVGFLVTHGTDTMAWGFTILRYMLKNFPYYVVITGSQLPMKTVYSPSDGYPNVRVAVEFLARARPKLGTNNVLVVFDYGKSILVSGLVKVRKWDIDAFIGIEGGRSHWGEFNIYNADVELEESELISRLDHLYVVRTGGTIEAGIDPLTGVLDATGEDIVHDFIRSDKRLVKCYDKIYSHLIVAKDSSNMNVVNWLTLGERIIEIASQYNSDVSLDTDFDTSVRVLYLNPFMGTREYEQTLTTSPNGLVIAGYGGGNCNIAKDRKTGISEPCSTEKMLKKAKKKGTIVILASQVPEEPTDFKYNVGKIPISDYGVLPSGGYSVPECQIRLSYILGHRDVIDRVAKEHNLSSYNLTRAAFVAGLEFINNGSKRDFERIVKDEIKVLDKDPFINRDFQEAIRIVAQQQSPSKETRLSEDDQWADINRDYREAIRKPTFYKIKTIQGVLGQFIRDFPRSSHLDCAKMYLGDMYVLTDETDEAEQLYREIERTCRIESRVGAVKDRLDGLYKDDDDDKYSNTMELVLGTDPKAKLSHPLEFIVPPDEDKNKKSKKRQKK